MYLSPRGRFLNQTRLALNFLCIAKKSYTANKTYSVYTLTTQTLPDHPNTSNLPYSGYPYYLFPAQWKSLYSSHIASAQEQRSVAKTSYFPPSKIDTGSLPWVNFLVHVRAAVDSSFTKSAATRTRTFGPHYARKTKTRPVSEYDTVHVPVVQAARGLYWPQSLHRSTYL